MAVTSRARGLGRAARGAAGLVVFLLALEALGRSGVVSRTDLPPSSDILARAVTLLGDPRFLGSVGATLQAWFFGLLIATAVGVPLGVLLGSVPGVNAAAGAIVEFLRPIPSVALIPLAVLLFGTDLGSTLVLVVYASFWQVLVQVLHGVVDVDPVADDTARSYRLSRWSRIRYVTWPSALPYVLTGLRLGAAVALILAVTAELVIGSPGLGQQIAVAQSSNAVPLVYALVIATGGLGVAVNVAVRALERAALAWHPSVRSEVPA